MIDKLKDFFAFYKDIISSRGIILKLAKNDFRTKYASSYLGTVWAFIQPLVTILVYFFVFQFGLRAKSPVGNFTYVLWLICGIIPWFYFSEAMTSGAYSLVEYSYLVKKMVFKINILPVVKITSSFFTHCFFIFFIFFMFFLYGHNPNIYNIQFLYYSLCMYILVAGISLVTSSIMVFFKDMGQIVTILMNIGFWATPIIWATNILPHRLWINIFYLNPMFYVVQGYRDTFIDRVWFWQRGYLTLYFWFITLVFLILGRQIFKKLKPHFSDVL